MTRVTINNSLPVNLSGVNYLTKKCINLLYVRGLMGLFLLNNNFIDDIGNKIPVLDMF